MIDDILRRRSLSVAEEVAIKRLGAAVVLNWATLPKSIQDDLLQQVLALDSSSADAVQEALDQLLPKQSST